MRKEFAHLLLSWSGDIGKPRPTSEARIAMRGLPERSRLRPFQRLRHGSRSNWPRTTSCRRHWRSPRRTRQPVADDAAIVPIISTKSSILLDSSAAASAISLVLRQAYNAAAGYPSLWAVANSALGPVGGSR
jgi:hypothetical protein